MEIDIQHKKIELIQWLTTLEDDSIIEKLIKFRDSESTDWWEEISETEKQSILKGIADAEAGKLNPQSEASKIYGKWL